jgi:membrane protein DedA with SNARE-associated domain
MLTSGALRYPTRKFLITEGVATIIWAAFFAFIGYIGGESYEDHPAKGLLLAFAIGIVLAVIVEIGRRIVMRTRGRVAASPEQERLPETEETQTYTAA